MTSAEAPTVGTSLSGNLVIGGAAVALGAVVIPYGASMPYIREGIPGPGLFPMMIGGFLILFGVLLILTSLRAARRAAAPAAPAEEAMSVAVPADATDTTHASDTADATDAPQAEAVMDTDIGSDGPRRWINGAVLMGSIVFFVLAAEPLGFPLTMAIVVFAIVFSLRARWWTAALTAVFASVGLWAMFELGLMVQLPDGIIQGF